MSADDKRSILDVAIDLVEKSLEKGYVQAWFSWLGWLTMSSIIYAFGSKADSFVVQALGAVSIMVTFVAGLVGVERLRDDWLDAKIEVLPRWINLSVVLLLAAIGVYLISEIVGVVFKVTLIAGG